MAGKPEWTGGEENGKAVIGQVKGKVPETSFLIDRSRLLEPYI